MTEPDNNDANLEFQRNMLNSFIQISALVLLVWMCVLIVQPFLALVLWGALIAIALYPAHLALAARLGGSQKRSALLLVVVGLIALLTPVWLTSESSISFAQGLETRLKDGTLTIPQPNPAVAEWPLVGPGLLEQWQEAQRDLPAFLDSWKPQLARAGEWVLLATLGIAFGVLQFAGSIIIGGALLLTGPGSYRFSCHVAERIAGRRGQALVDLGINTIRSVSKGVLGVAFVQAALAGVGFALIGLPAPGILAALVLVTAIVQIPATLIMLPLIIWVYSFADPTSATIFAVYSVAVALCDNVLKPMLLGRGLDIPMLVILIGAIGGAVASGVVGLFVGAVLLALGYTIIVEWAADAPSTHATAASTADDDTSGEPVN